ncbi:6714_t:CDS:2 [Dentiscutata erythropus]|uniref:6714_t:CDS:1 n=1 Tax=Dentiscutata erythropus TaxID=1348616 RepID=A0A9N9HEH1_9GLOM|nr:6714_t:CDS:2 [Dentiscutata erythropus]
MVKSCNPNIKRQDLIDAANEEWRKYRKEPETTIKKQITSSKSSSSTSSSLLSDEILTVTPNAPVQQKSLMQIKDAKAKITEYEYLLTNTNDKDLRYQIFEKLKDARAIIEKEISHLSLLKHHAASQGKYQEKK